jgi:antitoxin VapB
MATTRQFKSGNSQAVRIPADMAFAESETELTITRLGDVITIYPKRSGFKDMIEQLRRLPKAPPMGPVPRTELPDRYWD